MKMKQFTFEPIDRGCCGEGYLNEKLKGAVHIQTYTRKRLPSSSYTREKDLIIFAFYPDEKEVLL